MNTAVQNETKSQHPTKPQTTSKVTNKHQKPSSKRPSKTAPPLNLTAEVPSYSLTKQDRRLNGIIFVKVKGSQQLRWSLYNPVVNRTDTNTTLIVVGKGPYEVQDYLRYWSEYVLSIFYHQSPSFYYVHSR